MHHGKSSTQKSYQYWDDPSASIILSPQRQFSSVNSLNLFRLSRGGGRVGGRGAGGESRLKGREVIVTEHCSTDFFQSQFLILASGNICRGPSSQWWIFVGGQGNARQVLRICDQWSDHPSSCFSYWWLFLQSNQQHCNALGGKGFSLCFHCPGLLLMLQMSPQSLFFSTLLTQGWGVCWRCEASAARIPEERRRAAWSWGLRGDCDDHGGVMGLLSWLQWTSKDIADFTVMSFWFCNCQPNT